MAMLYDIAQALKGARTDGQSKSSIGGATGSVTVRHGTVQSVSGSWAQVILDGSESPITVTCEVTPVPNQRVTVVRQGAAYKVISLGDIQTTIDSVQSDVTSVKSDVSTINTTVNEHSGKIDTAYSRLDTNEAAIAQNQKVLEAAQASIKSNEQAIADEISERQTAVDDARKVAENFIDNDSTGAIVVADMSQSEDERNSIVLDSFGMRVREAGEDVATFGKVCTLGKTSEFHSTVSQEGTQFLDAAGDVLGSITEDIVSGSVVGMKIATDETRSITVSVPSTTAPEEIFNTVEVDSDGVFAGRNEAFAYIGYEGSAAVAKATATNDITLTTSGGNIVANAYMGGVKYTTSSALLEMSTSNTSGVALETSGGLISLLSCPTSSRTKGAQIKLNNAGTMRLVAAPPYGIGLEAYIAGNRINLNCTSGIVTNDTKLTPSTSYTACNLLTFGPVNILVINGQSIGTTAWAAGTHTLFTLAQYHRPSVVTTNVITTGSTSAACRIQITSAGVVSVVCSTILAASTKLYGQLVWVATQ